MSPFRELGLEANRVMKKRIGYLVVVLYSLYCITESHFSYIKFQRGFKKNLTRTLTNVTPDRTAEAILKEFSEFSIDPRQCPKNFILIPEITNPGIVPIQQVVDYSFNPCPVKIVNNIESSGGYARETLILVAKHSSVKLIFNYNILKTSENYNLIEVKE